MCSKADDPTSYDLDPADIGEDLESPDVSDPAFAGAPTPGYIVLEPQWENTLAWFVQGLIDRDTWPEPGARRNAMRSLLEQARYLYSRDPEAYARVLDRFPAVD